MKKVLLGVLAAAMLTGAAPIAHAAGETIRGGCNFDTNRQATATNGENVGVIGVVAFAQDASGGPTSATVSCKIQVNNSDAPGTEFSYSGNGAIVGSNQISFHAEDGDSVTLCEKVDFGSGGSYDCTPSDSFQIPPDEFFTVLDLIFATLDDVLTTVDTTLQPVFDILDNLQRTYTDPVLCPLLGARAGTYGPITISAAGDVYFTDPTGSGLDIQLNDCPPYGS